MKSKRKQRDSYLRRTYGITLAQYERKLATQGGCCDLCGRHRSEFNKNLAQDHNHLSKNNRGIVCFYCNKYRIGRLTVEWARKIYEYLKRHDGEPA